MNQLKSVLIGVIKSLLFLTALTPLIVVSKIPFPFVLGKILFFRSIIEITLILFIVHLFLLFNQHKSAQIGINQRLKICINPFKSALISVLILFLISLIISTVFAVNPYRAFWGDLERGEGLFGFLHFFAFLIMAVAIFEKKDWLNFFKLSLGVGFILIFYAFLQYFHVRNFPFLFISEVRPFSFIGNPSFLATHMFFLMMFAVVIFYQHKSAQIGINQRFNIFWKYFSFLIIILSALTIFITATRGAIVGLGASILFLLVYFSFKKTQINIDNYLHQSAKIRINQRFISIILLSLIIIFSATFWLTRGAEIWQKIPGFNRLAQTMASGKVDASTQFRLMTWQLSWEAFKEKPVFGWGNENFLVAYEKHYNPDYAIYGESWLDRAHNKIFDVLVMQGIFGVLAYLGIFIASFYLLIKRPLIRADSKLINADNIKSVLISQNQHKSVFIIAIIIGYFVQNLFVMDQIISDFTFFAMIGFIISISKQEQVISKQESRGGKLFLVTSSLLLIPIFILGYSLYSYNYIPYTQAKIINEVKVIERASLIENKLKEATSSYNFSQFDLRAYIVDYYNNYQVHIFQNASLEPLADFFVNLVNDIIEREPYDVRMFIRKTQIAQNMASYEPILYKEAEDSMRRAIELAPNRQELYYNLAFSLLGQEKYQEAVETSIKAIELNPNVARAHYHLAFVLAVIGSQNENEIIGEMEIADKLNPNFESLRAGDHNIIALIYSRLGRSDKVAEIVLKKINLGLPSKFFLVYYEEALGYFAATRDADNFIKTAKDVTSSISTLKDDMDVLIDLAEKGNWTIIDSLAR
ncbi:MAG: O-antigen ligase family protein [Patescibacteria group bacterium]